MSRRERIVHIVTVRLVVTRYRGWMTRNYRKLNEVLLFRLRQLNCVNRFSLGRRRPNSYSTMGASTSCRRDYGSSVFAGCAHWTGLRAPSRDLNQALQLALSSSHWSGELSHGFPRTSRTSTKYVVNDHAQKWLELTNY